jgi:hypothetical protein
MRYIPSNMLKVVRLVLHLCHTPISPFLWPGAWEDAATVQNCAAMPLSRTTPPVTQQSKKMSPRDRLKKMRKKIPKCRVADKSMISSSHVLDVEAREDLEDGHIGTTWARHGHQRGE